MTTPTSRRSFLRSLSCLPFVAPLLAHALVRPSESAPTPTTIHPRRYTTTPQGIIPVYASREDVPDYLLS